MRLENSTSTPQQLIDTAWTLGVELIVEEVHNPTEFAAAFASMHSKGADAVLLRSSPLFLAFRKEVCEMSKSLKLPAIVDSARNLIRVVHTR